MKVTNLVLGLILLAGGFFVGSSWKNADQNELPSKDIVSKAGIQSLQSGREIDPPLYITDIEKATIKIFEESSPSVAFITTSQVRRNYWSRNEMEIPQGSGSGFIWDEDGHIVTNFHVIEGSSRIKVTLANQKSYDATLVGSEPSKDLAVLKINPREATLQPIKVGSYSELKVGQSAYAIGNPFGLDHSLTTGIISALGREITTNTGRTIKDVIQTDAAINPGNSGGPLLDSSSRLIGVNTMIYSPSGASAGIGFSIPVDVVNWVVPDIIKYGEVRKPVLGISLIHPQYASRMELDGVMVSEVMKNTGAEKAGLRGFIRNREGYIEELGDIIVAINDQKITSHNDLFLELEKYSPDDKILVKYIRNDKTYETDLVLGSSVK